MPATRRCNARMTTLFTSLPRGNAFICVASSSVSRRGRAHGALLRHSRSHGTTNTTAVRAGTWKVPLSRS